MSCPSWAASLTERLRTWAGAGLALLVLVLRAQGLAWVSPDGFWTLLTARNLNAGGLWSGSSLERILPACSELWVRAAQGAMAWNVDPIWALHALGWVGLVLLVGAASWRVGIPWGALGIALCAPALQAALACEATALAAGLGLAGLVLVLRSEAPWRWAVGAVLTAAGAALEPSALAAYLVGGVLALRAGQLRAWAMGVLLLLPAWSWHVGVLGLPVWPQLRWDPAAGWAALWPMWVELPLLPLSLVLGLVGALRRRQVALWVLGGAALLQWSWSLALGQHGPLHQPQVLDVGAGYWVGALWLLAMGGVWVRGLAPRWRPLAGVAGLASLMVPISVAALEPDSVQDLPASGTVVLASFYTPEQLRETQVVGLGFAGQVPQHESLRVALSPGQEALAWYAGLQALALLEPERELRSLQELGVELRLAYRTPAPQPGYNAAQVGGLPAQMIRYHRPTVQALAATGAQIPDFERVLEAWIERDMRGLGPAGARVVAVEFEAYYFAHSSDPERRARIAAYLGQ